MNKLEEIQDKILKLWSKSDDKTAIDMFVGWIGFDFMDYIFKDSIRNYDNYEVLQDFYNHYKKMMEVKDEKGRK